MKFLVDVYSEPESLTGVELDQAVARRCSVGDIPTRSARAFGDRIALVDDSGELSYNDLEKQSNRLAHGLRALGIEQREPIAILSPNCNEYLVSYFGIAKMGGSGNPGQPLGRGRSCTLFPIQYRLSSRYLPRFPTPVRPDDRPDGAGGGAHHCHQVGHAWRDSPGGWR